MDNINYSFQIQFQKVYCEKTVEYLEKDFVSKRAGKRKCYLDHAGSTLYSNRQISDIFDDFKENCYGNPHAKNDPSILTEDNIDQRRHEILQHFNTDSEKYSVIFTSGATSALKMIAESFCYYQNGVFAYLEDNHTSVIGMREYAEQITCLSTEKAFEIFDSKKNEKTPKNHDSNSLFVYPAQSNFSGYKYPLSWSESVKKGSLNQIFQSRWFCMLDASSYVPSSRLDLSQNQPDFVCFSFHKMFGYPTGLGVLLIKNSSGHVLKKKYFGGGSVSMVLSKEKNHVTRTNLHERFEDGTLPYHSIIAIRHGFNNLKRLQLSMELISKHTFNLAKYTYQILSLLHHFNGRPVVVLYHDSHFENSNVQGGIVNFNLLKSTGKYVGYAQFQHVANLFGISLRTGCSCNPGACQKFLNLTSEKLKQHFQLGHVCGDENDLIDGDPTGSIRISFGYMSTKQDADTLINMIVDCFVQKPLMIRQQTEVIPSSDNNNNNERIISINNGEEEEEEITGGRLKQIFVYPIKSCASYEIKDEWELNSTGLKYDREWMIVTSSRIALTQKRETRLCLLKPIINIDEGTMDLEFEGNFFKSLPLTVPMSKRKLISNKCLSKVCGDKIEGWDCGDEIANWLDEIFDMTGLRLLKHCSDEESLNCRTSKDETKSAISLSNQAQFLLINTKSIDYLLEKLSEDNFSESTENFNARFRPNFVVELKRPFIENKLKILSIGNTKFTFVGQCNRCQMICVDQNTGEKSAKPLKVISENLEGKLKFGIYLSQEKNTSDNYVNVSDPVIVHF